VRKQFLRAFTLLLALQILLSLNCINTYADEAAAQEQTGSICVQYPVDGASAFLWRIGDYSPDGKVTLEGKFAEYDAKMTNEAAKDAVTLSNLVFGTVEPYASGISQNGMVGFSNLKRGVYLLYTAPMTAADGYYYTFIPSIFYLPFAEETAEGVKESWNLQIIVKNAKSKLPEELLVRKAWKGNSVSRLTAVSIDLYCDGVFQETVTLNAKNKWSYSWPINQNACAWTVRESAVPDGFTMSVTETESGFVVTNTCPNKSSKLPQTGQLWWPVPLLLIAGSAMLTAGILMKRRKA